MKAFAVLALGAAVAIWWLQHREEPVPPPPAPVAKKAVAAPKPAPEKPKPKVVAAKPRPKPAPIVLKEIPPPEKQPAPQPVALAEPQPQPPAPPRVEPPRAEPPAGDSVFGWGPWSQTASGGATQNPPDLPGTPAYNVTHVLPATQVSTNGANPPLPPLVPPADSNVRPGHGWGDRNHLHVHRRGRD